MVPGVIGPAGPPFDNDTFRASVFAGSLRGHIIFAVPSTRKFPLAILKGPATDIAGRRLAASILNGLEDGLGFSWYFLLS